MLPSHKKSEDQVLVISGIINIIKFEALNVFSQIMIDADNSYWDTLFHETQFSIELHVEIVHCAHN